MASPVELIAIYDLMQKMKAENASLKAENASLKAENDSLKAENRTKQDLIAELSRENSNLQTETSKSEIEMRDLKSALAKIEAEKIALEKQYEYKQRTLQYASLRKLEEQSRLVKFERDRAEDAEAKFVDMKAQLADTKAQLADAEDNFRQMAGAMMYQDH